MFFLPLFCGRLLKGGLKIIACSGFFVFFTLAMGRRAFSAETRKLDLAAMYPEKIILENCEGSLRCLQRLADQGSAVATYLIGQFLWEKRRYEESLPWFWKAYLQDVSKASYYLALSYEKGYGQKQNDRLALRLLKDAALRGVAPAAFHMGETHMKGGIAQEDLIEAYSWFGIAKDLGAEGADAVLLRLDKTLKKEERRMAEALRKEIEEAAPNFPLTAAPDMIWHTLSSSPFESDFKKFSADPQPDLPK